MSAVLRLRVGDRRVIDDLNEQGRIVLVTIIGNRNEVYRHDG